MDSQLQSISKIFTEKLFRIPDYQRGYAWGLKQLKDYWSDVLQLEQGKNHYVGVLTLEKVSSTIYNNWEDDQWIIDSKSFEPFYIVDGQQRMTTTIILIQAITELFDQKEKLNYTEIIDIKRRFIFDSKDEGISKSYIFGYEKDNPSYDFLKRSIFKEDGGYNYEETIYTHNLDRAKNYFIENLKKLKKDEIEIIFRKVTQNLLFNIYTIGSDIDVFIAFETMNNRGKPLSNLELLKNRLIYLSTKFNADSSEKNKLRKDVNDSWKAIYHYLGKNRNKPLNDDVFLLNHFIIYFGEEIGFAKDETYNSRFMIHHYKNRYESYLLDDKFTVKSILGHSIEDEAGEQQAVKQLSIPDVHKYVSSLQKAVEIWYNVHNPIDCKGFSDDEKTIFERIMRMGTKSFLPLILVCYQKKLKAEVRVELLTSLERYLFIHLLYTYRHYPDMYDFSFYAVKLNSGSKSIADVIKFMDERVHEINTTKDIAENLAGKFKSESFYKWLGIRFFLFEYEQSLKAKTKTSRQRIDWDEFSKDVSDYITVEHIYPQTPRSECWTKSFSTSQYTLNQRKALNNSLGNLLALSRAKNSSLQNKCFTDKVDNDNFIGFRFGSYSEIEISKKANWTPKDILDRGIKLLEFMESRWNIGLGDKEQKARILGLDFMTTPKI